MKILKKQTASDRLVASLRKYEEEIGEIATTAYLNPADLGELDGIIHTGQEGVLFTYYLEDGTFQLVHVYPSGYIERGNFDHLVVVCGDPYQDGTDAKQLPAKTKKIKEKTPKVNEPIFMIY
jgi:hypothetical protein